MTHLGGLGTLPWLPQGFEFLSGLDSAARKRRIIVTVQVFVDDSGGKNQGPVFVLFALIHDAKTWAAFSDDWRDCLTSAPRIDVFKMQDASTRKRNFRGFSEASRDGKLRDLIQILNRHKPRGLYCCVDTGAHKELIEPNTGKAVRSVYFHGFVTAVSAIGIDLANTGQTERCEIIFDEQKKFSRYARLWYPIVGEALGQPEKSILPQDILFRDDAAYLPLQACDLMAWLTRRMFGGPVSPLYWMANEITGVALSPESQFVGRKRLASILDQSYRPEQLIPRFGQVMEKMRRHFSGDPFAFSEPPVEPPTSEPE